LRVGPKSAGSVPGPACYGRGGTDATVTDAAVALDYINPQRFLGGRMKLDRGAALTALQRLAEILGASTDETANAILEISSEAMIRAIQDITINDGIDPAESVVVAGGGAAGLNVLTISASLGCRKVIIPRSAGVLSATGGHFSDIAIDFSGACFTSTAALDGQRVAAMLGGLRQRASDFEDSLRTKGIANFRRELFVEARYHGQQAEFEIRVPDEWAEKPEDPRVLKRSFDAQYLRRYGTSRSDVEIETINWRMRTSALVLQPLVPEPRAGLPAIERHVHAYFGGSDRIRTRVLDGRGIESGDRITGPAIIEETTTTIVVAPGMTGYLSKQGNYIFEIATSHD
jgi:N-methylhydantoinase A